MQRKLIVVHKVGEMWKPLKLENSTYDIRDTEDMPPSFWDQIGRNTSYMIHPEETIADNFMHMVQLHHSYVSNPEILLALGQIFSEIENTAKQEVTM